MDRWTVEASTGNLQLTAEQLLQHQEELREARGGAKRGVSREISGLQKAESMYNVYIYIYDMLYLYIYIYVY